MHCEVKKVAWRRTSWLSCVMAWGLCGAPGLPADDAAPASAQPASTQETQRSDDFALQGEYVKEGLGVQVVALGEGEFRAVIHQGGLPGAGWNRGERQSLEESAEGIRELIESLELKKVERRSETLGAPAPPGAVVLFDGSEESLAQWGDGTKRVEGNLLAAGCTSVEKFTDFTLHVEFRTPFMPAARGQGRGNSGVYCQGRYEAQVLDSFGEEGRDNEAGGIYSVRAPDLNMCFPPGSWQTYDIDFTAARWNEAGEKTADARMTVRLNGVAVQRDVPVPHVTTAAPVAESPEPGPIYLQDHGNPVAYRNIWVLPRDAAQEARRPIVAGFERFHRAAVSTAGLTEAGTETAVAGGRLLLGELGCTNCHAAEGKLAEHLLPRQAPILTAAGSRLRPEWMRDYLLDPHGHKPGTTMPDLLGALPEEERSSAAEALVNFLLTTGRVADEYPDLQAAQRGARLFHDVGCAQCHAPRDGREVPEGSSVPLENVGEKYTIPSLAAFLADPHAVRPSGRMPGWDLKEPELRDLATFLAGDAEAIRFDPNVRYTVWHGSWDRLPDFDELPPAGSGECAGLDLSVAGRDDGFGVRFEAFLELEESNYTFTLGSDDGSRLWLNDELLIENDGIHPHEEKSAKAVLAAGVYRVRVDYFEGGGESSLKVEVRGRGQKGRDIGPLLRLEREAPQSEPRPSSDAPAARSREFVFDESQVERGRTLFASLGCASCHQLELEGKAIASELKSPSLAECRVDRGCLSSSPGSSPNKSPGKAPDYDLSFEQLTALRKGVEAGSPEQSPAPREQLSLALTAFNCLACHSRDGIGGATAERNELFRTRIPEMGDEGRLPPPLDGVGDKLNDRTLQRVVERGAKDRPYMRTQMPRFGAGTAAHVAGAFAALDRREQGGRATFDEPVHRTKSTGRELVGERGLACIKCHDFGPHRGSGIQAIDLQTMTSRLREDWFLRYLVDPNAYRPGTRMPTGFPEGQASVRGIYDGDVGRQTGAIWEYLADGERAALPDGVVAQLQELVPGERPIVYRNFIEGLSARGIAVGYPEKGHLAWDANEMSLSLIWHGRFIDASRHWSARGQGFEGPLGDHVLKWEESPAVAVLADADAAWPQGSARERGYRFRGYRLNERGEPTFLYSGEGFEVEDFPEPVAKNEAEGVFRREVRVRSTGAREGVAFRAARGKEIAAHPEGGWLVDGAVRVQLEGGAAARLRKGENGMELIVPLDLSTGSATVVQRLEW